MEAVRLFRHCSRVQRLYSHALTNPITTSVQKVGCFHPPVRFASVFPSFFIHPIFRGEEQEKLRESGEAARLAYVPVRVANTEHTGSMYYDPIVEKLINHVMREGKKKNSRTLVEKAFRNIKIKQLARYYDTKDPDEREKIILNPNELLRKAVENAKPFLETTPVKRGGHTYQVPVPIREKKQQALAIKWLIEAGKDKPSEQTFEKQLAYEILDAANNSGKVIKRKQELHKKCEANRAYAHYRWS